MNEEQTEEYQDVEQCKSVEYEVRAVPNIEESKTESPEVATKPEKLWANANRYKGTVGEDTDNSNDCYVNISDEDNVPSPSLLPFSSMTRNRMMGYVDLASGDTSLIMSLTQSHLSQDNLQSISSIGLPTK